MSRSRLTETEVAAILSRIGEAPKRVAGDFGIHRTSVTRIWRGESYSAAASSIPRQPREPGEPRQRRW